MSVKDQQALDRLYAIDNVLTIEITMPQADWDAVRTEQPAGGRVQLRLGGRQPLHVAQGSLGQNIRNKFSRSHDVHRRRSQEEILLRIDQQ